MKTQNIILVVFMLFIGISSCKPTQKVQTNEVKTTGENSMNSLDWDGAYQGVLPCADCEGIKTRIVLQKDLSYLLETKYPGKDEKVFQAKGTFKWDENGNKITLDDTNKQIYLVGENKLFHLDKDGNRITGDLADNYIIEKEKIEITGKYWKLVRLNGQPVEVGRKEPFIKFQTENNRVAGNNSCNTFNGTFELINANEIKFSQMATTKMACMDSNVEDEFMQVLGKTTNYSLTANELIFQDEYETTLAKFESDYFK